MIKDKYDQQAHRNHTFPEGGSKSGIVSLTQMKWALKLSKAAYS